MACMQSLHVQLRACSHIRPYPAHSANFCWPTFCVFALGKPCRFWCDDRDGCSKMDAAQFRTRDVRSAGWGCCRCWAACRTCGSPFLSSWATQSVTPARSPPHIFAFFHQCAALRLAQPAPCNSPRSCVYLELIHIEFGLLSESRIYAWKLGIWLLIFRNLTLV